MRFFYRYFHHHAAGSYASESCRAESGSYRTFPDVLGNRRSVKLPGQHAYISGVPDDCGYTGIYKRNLHHAGNAAGKMLSAISCGAVFMGANTYIGNAPNFMVKSISDENGVNMPSFFGYMLWSVSILIPVFIIDMLVFFL